MAKKITISWVIVASLMGVASAGCMAEVEPTESVELAAGIPNQFITTDHHLTDATMAKAAPTTNYGASPSCVSDAGLPQRACLMRWDLSAIHSTATVLAATLKFEVFNHSAQIFNIDQVYGTWSESTVTWNIRKTGVPWQTPGARNAADRAFAPFASFKGTLGIHEIPLYGAGLEVVRRWVLMPWSNAGLVIDNIHATDGIEIRTKESTSGLHPYLHIIYQMP
jgi:hypothetical protein